MNKYEQVVKAINEGKSKREIIFSIGCSSSYLRFVRRKISNPDRVNEQSKDLKMTEGWKKKFTKSWNETVQTIKEERHE